MRDAILVTGATGFIGRHVVRCLLDRGARVRVFVRQPQRLPPDIADRVHVVTGRMQDRNAVRRAVVGSRSIIHLAACARAWSRDVSEFAAVNVDGVAALLEVAGRCDLERLVHVSTVLTLPPHRPAPLQGRCEQPTPYEESKLAGERLVESYSAQGGPAVILHPTRVFGPGPLTDANAVTKAIALYLSGQLRLRLADGDVQANYVHVHDVAAAVVDSATRGRIGAHYVVGGENATFRQFLSWLGEVSGVQRRMLALPARAALALARAAELSGHLGGPVPITPGWIRILMEDRRVGIEPARRDLGYAPRPLRERLRHTVAWLGEPPARAA